MPKGCGDGSAQPLLLRVSFTFFQEKGQRSPHGFSGFTLPGKPKSRSSLVREKEATLMPPGMGKPFLFLTKILRTLVFPMPEWSHYSHCVPRWQATAPDPLPPALLPQPCVLGHLRRCLSPTFPLPPGLSCLSPPCSSLPKGCLTSSFLAKANFKPKRRNKFEIGVLLYTEPEQKSQVLGSTSLLPI